MPRLSAHLQQRDRECDLSIAGHRGHRNHQRVHEGRRQRQPCAPPLLPRVRLSPLCRLDGSAWAYGHPPGHPRRSILRQAGREHLGCQCAQLGMPGSVTRACRRATRASTPAQCGLTCRSTGPPTAAVHARATHRLMLLRAGMAVCLRGPVNSTLGVTYPTAPFYLCR